MATQIVSKKFDPKRGAVVLNVEDDFGVRTVHTIHISHDHEVCGGCGRRMDHGAGPVDLNHEITAVLAEAEARAAKLRAACQAAGVEIPEAKA